VIAESSPIPQPSPTPPPEATPTATPSESSNLYDTHIDLPVPSPIHGTIEVVTPITAPSSYSERVFQPDIQWRNHDGFADVSHERWYYDAVTFVAMRGLFSGVGNDMFAPSSYMTRGMFVAVLSRLGDENTSQFSVSPFSDVEIEQWYGQAVAWATEKGIIDAYILKNNPAGEFQPHAPVTREEMAHIFANYIGVMGFPLNLSEIPIFYDLYQAGFWARDAIQSMRSLSIISGIGNNLYNPQGKATRAEAAQIFANFIITAEGLNW
jgi:hypothetical protein